MRKSAKFASLLFVFFSQTVFSEPTQIEGKDVQIMGGYGLEELESDAGMIQKASNQQTICKGSSIPAGWIITAETSLGGCYLSFPDAWIIVNPTMSQYSVCKISPVPEGWAAVSLTSGNCPGTLPNMYIIKKLTAPQETICKSSVVPSGWRIVGESWANCPGSQPSAWVINRS